MLAWLLSLVNHLFRRPSVEVDQSFDPRAFKEEQKHDEHAAKPQPFNLESRSFSAEENIKEYFRGHWEDRRVRISMTKSNFFVNMILKLTVKFQNSLWRA